MIILNKQKIITNNPPKWHLITGIAATILAGVILTNQQAFAASEPSTLTMPTTNQLTTTSPLSGQQVVLATSANSQPTTSLVASDAQATSASSDNHTSVVTADQSNRPTSTASSANSTTSVTTTTASNAPSNATTATVAAGSNAGTASATTHTSDGPTNISPDLPTTIASTGQNSDGSTASPSTTLASPASISTTSSTVPAASSSTATAPINATISTSVAPASGATSVAGASNAAISSSAAADQPANTTSISTELVSAGIGTTHPATTNTAPSSSVPVTSAVNSATSSAMSATTNFITSAVNSIAASTVSEVASAASAESAATSSTSATAPASTGTPTTFQITSAVNSIAASTYSEYAAAASAEAASAGTVAETPATSVGTIIPTTAPSESIDTWMPNKHLQTAVLRELQALKLPDHQFNSVNDITKDDMQLLTKFYGNDTYIDGQTAYSLEGLQYATNLTTIWLNNGLNALGGYYNGDVTDISPLAGLTKLTVLNIQHNRVSDLSPIAHLTNLEELDVAYNHIADLSIFKDLPNLKTTTYVGQTILEPLVYVDQNTASATLKNYFYLPNGQQATFKSQAAILKPIQLTPDGQFYYRFYFNGAGKAVNGDLSNVVPDGQGGLTFNQLVPQIPGFTGDANGQFSVGGINVNVMPNERNFYLVAQGLDGTAPVFHVFQPYVLAAKAAPVTVQHLDRTGVALREPEELTGLVGEDYQSTPADIPNYTHVDTQGAPQGTFSAEPQTVAYVYEKTAGAPVTVSYQDEQGQTLKPDTTCNGFTGDAYTTDPLTIDGYDLVKTPTNATGTFTSEPQHVIYVYTKQIPQPVTASYQDETGQTLKPDITHTGEIGTAYQTEALVIPGYDLVKTTGDATGTFTKEPQHVVYVYTKQIPQPVTASYQDAAGQTLKPDITHTGEIGATYQTEALVIPGYDLVKTTGDATGTFTKEPQHVVYVYAKQSVLPVTVSYQDADGKPIHADVILAGDFGQNYQTEQLAIPGYVFSKVTGPISGTFGATAQHVIYAYTPEPSVPGTPAPKPEPEPQPVPEPIPQPGLTPVPKPQPSPVPVPTPGSTSNSSSAPQAKTPLPPDIAGLPDTKPASVPATTASEPIVPATASAQPNAKTPAQTNSTTAGQLPQTNEQSEHDATIWGLLAALFAGLGWLGLAAKFKKHE